MRPVLYGLLVLLVVSSASAVADEIYVPFNKVGTGTRNSWPFNAGLYQEWRYQLIIPPKYLGGQPYSIQDIAFGPSGTGRFTASTFEVRMSHSTVAVSATFATNLAKPVTVLAAKNYVWKTVDKQWSPLGLTGLFNYDGNSGLTIEIRYIGGALTTAFSGTIYYNSGYHHRIWKQGAGSFSATSGSLGKNTGLDIRITVIKAQIIPGGTPAPGNTITFTCLSPSDAGKVYQVGSSLGQGPIPIGNFKLELSADNLLVASTSGLLPTVFQNYTGKLDNAGRGTASMAIPNLSVLKGVRFYSAYLTLDPQTPSGVSQVSPNVLVTIK